MERKVKLNIAGGGIFSKMMLGVQNIESDKLDVQDCYFSTVDHRALNEAQFNPFNYILDQTLSQDHIDFQCHFQPSYNSKNHSGKGQIENSSEYLRLKDIASGLQYQEDLIQIIDSHAKILDTDTVGVHIRMCDMNIYHASDYGKLMLDDYIKAITDETDSGSRVFVASDNLESLEKLRALFGSRLLYVDGLMRAKTEAEDTLNLQIDNLNNPTLWKEAFLEMLLLSKCSKLICRTSNLANMAIISSNTIKKIIML